MHTSQCKPCLRPQVLVTTPFLQVSVNPLPVTYSPQPKHNLTNLNPSCRCLAIPPLLLGLQQQDLNATLPPPSLQASTTRDQARNPTLLLCHLDSLRLKVLSLTPRLPLTRNSISLYL